jgi:hypothetical protein
MSVMTWAKYHLEKYEAILFKLSQPTPKYFHPRRFSMFVTYIPLKEVIWPQEQLK